jgi:hypothetical protein
MATPGSACEFRVTDGGTTVVEAGKVSDDGMTCFPSRKLMTWMAPLNAGIACGTTITIPGPNGTMKAEARCVH